MNELHCMMFLTKGFEKRVTSSGVKTQRKESASSFKQSLFDVLHKDFQSSLSNRRVTVKNLTPKSKHKAKQTRQQDIIEITHCSFSLAGIDCHADLSQHIVVGCCLNP